VLPIAVRETPTRRQFLRTAGAVGAGGILAGRAGATAPGELLDVNVGYADESGLDATLSIATEVTRRYEWNALTVRAPRRRLKGLAGRADVRYVEADVEFRLVDSSPAPSLPADPSAQIEPSGQTLPYGVDRIDADVAHDEGVTGSGVHVAVVDTGIDSTHPDLRENLGEGKSFIPGIGTIFEERYPPWQDDIGHGTACAGIVGAVDNERGVVGVAPDVTLHAVKALTALGSGPASQIAAGVEYVARKGWDVANLSVGSRRPSALVREAIRFADERGVLLVAASGNDGRPATPPEAPAPDGEDDTPPPGGSSPTPPGTKRLPAGVSYPAAFPEVVAVGATTKGDGLASFSSTGPEIALAAPGVNILSTAAFGGYVRLSGTSFAAPHVAGAAALLIGADVGADGDATSDAIRQRLVETAEDVGLSSTEGGAGLVDAAAALGLDSTEGGIAVEKR
jgi:subtilisin